MMMMMMMIILIILQGVECQWDLEWAANLHWLQQCFFQIKQFSTHWKCVHKSKDHWTFTFNLMVACLHVYIILQKWKIEFLLCVANWQSQFTCKYKHYGDFLLKRDSRVVVIGAHGCRIIVVVIIIIISEIPLSLWPTWCVNHELASNQHVYCDCSPDCKTMTISIFAL